MKKLLIVSALAAAMCSPAQADGIYREGVAPVYVCPNGSSVSAFDQMGPRYVCALRMRAIGEYQARVRDMRERGFERKMDTLRSIDDGALKNGW